MKRFAFLISFFFVHLIEAQVSRFSNPIPDTILRNSNAVIRNYDTEITFFDKENYTIKVEMAVTVYNREGVSSGNLLIVQPLESEFKLIEARTIARGGQTERYYSMDNLQVGQLVNFSNEVKENSAYYFLDMESDHYPYTTLYRCEIKAKGTLNIPTWQPVRNKFTGLESASLNVKLKSDIQLNTYSIGNIQRVKADSNKREKNYSWSCIGQMPRHAKDSTQGPELRMTLSDFILLGSSGSMASWESFGNWIDDLNQGLYVLPEDLSQMVLDTADKYKNDSLVVQALYSFIQREFRYVSIQLGIGGFKPQSNEFTWKKGFGDCKALSLMMKSMLDRAGIESYYCLASMQKGKQDLIPEFPENRFNHVMICAKVYGKDTWIECTSKELKAGEPSKDVKGTYALLVSRDRSRLVKVE